MAIDYDVQRFHDGLAEHRLIVPVGVPGAFGRGEVFEEVLARFNALVTRRAVGERAEVVRFPPVIPRRLLEKSGFLGSFPHLAGSVFSFFGKDLEARELGERLLSGQPWGDMLGMTDVVLTPAACYPVYPTLTGRLPAGGRLVDTKNWTFRHEPSPEPTRMQAFRMREFIRAGPREVVVAWRDQSLERGLGLLLDLGLPARSEVASDPFFGRAGRMLASSQREQRLKFEVLVPIISEEAPTAVCSFNYHEEHFGKTFGIETEEGGVAQTACLGFGLERCVMALIRHHGYDPKSWPQPTRDLLWP
jgi:seryl-tRNA synthetase